MFFPLRVLPLLLLIVSAAQLGGIEATAQIPLTFSYQGIIDGKTGNVDISVGLYSSETGGVVLWSENHNSVPLSNDGVFNLVLGSRQGLGSMTFDRPYWLQVTVDGDVLLPRLRLSSVPYALRSIEAESVIDNALTPAAFNSGSSTPVDGASLIFDAATNEFVWEVVGSGPGGGIVRLTEGDGILIQNLTGPNATIGIAPNGIVERMLDTGAVTSRVIADASILSSDIANKSITQEKFADNVGLPNIGTAGGDLRGNYPNPTLKDSAVTTAKIANNAVTSVKIAPDAITGDDIADQAVSTEHINPNTRLTVASIVSRDSVITDGKIVADGLISTNSTLFVNGTGQINGNVGIGRAPTTPAVGKLSVHGTGTTSGTTGLRVEDSLGTARFVVRDNGTAGINTSTPRAGLEISRTNATGLFVSAGSTALSFASVPAGAAIPIPAHTTVVEITNDFVPNSPNSVGLPVGSNSGELLILINNDADPLIINGKPPVLAGASAIYIYIATVPTWQFVK